MRNEYTSYPYDFPNDAQASVECAKLRAGEVFDKAKEQILSSRWGALRDVEGLLKQYILSVFAVFAHEVCQLGSRGAWTVVRVHSECLDFLRLFSIEAHSDKGYDTNGNSLPFRPTENELKNSPEWKKYESERLEVAELQAGHSEAVRGPVTLENWIQADVREAQLSATRPADAGPAVYATREDPNSHPAPVVGVRSPTEPKAPGDPREAAGEQDPSIARSETTPNDASVTPSLDTARINKWIDDEGYTNETLAGKLHTSARAISSVRNAGGMHGDKLVTKLANLMNCNPDDLYR